MRRTSTAPRAKEELSSSQNLWCCCLFKLDLRPVRLPDTFSLWRDVFFAFNTYIRRVCSVRAGCYSSIHVAPNAPQFRTSSASSGNLIGDGCRQMRTHLVNTTPLFSARLFSYLVSPCFRRFSLGFIRLLWFVGQEFT